jgi:hypothetical protein
MRPTFRLLPWVSLLACLPLLLPACGSRPAQTGTEDAFAAACADLVAQRVAYTQRCPGFDPGDTDARAAVATCIGVATAPGSLLTVGDVEACTQALAAPCAPLLYPSCAGYGQNLLYPNHDKRGSGPPGAACVAHLQCASGYCSGLESCGQCQVPRDVGQPCTDPLDVCTGLAQCTAGTCQLPGKPEGAACIDYGSECQSTLYCNATGGLNGVCTALPGAGAPCAKGSCAGDLACPAGVCVERLPDGASCDAAHPCQDVCAGGVCRTRRVVGQNESCAFDTCAPGLACSADPANRVCITQVVSPKGSACGASAAPPCAPGLICDTTTAVCADLPGDGEPCTAYGTCAHGTTCVGFAPADHQAGVCTRLGEVGEPCPCPFELACVAGMCVAYGAAACM